MPLYRHQCIECRETLDLICPIAERDQEVECPSCDSRMKRVVGNDGGFRLGKAGSVGWSEDGYATTHGDAENFKAGRKVY